MLEVSQVLQFKQLAGQGVPIREISRQLQVSRNTVRRYLRGAEPGVYRQTKPRPQPATAPIRERVRALLEEERERATPKKQRLTATRIHRILVDEGFSGSERTVRAAVRAIRHELRDPLERAHLPLSYEPGQDAQVDFMERWIDDATEGRVKCFVLSVRACFSRRVFRYAAPNQTREALFEGLMRAFEFFGGVFLHLWFDNLTPAVKKVLQGRDRELQRDFELFQAHYGYKAEFCGRGKGNEKGGVENDVKWASQEVFSPIPRVDGRAGVQELLDGLAERELDRRTSGEERTIGERWRLEQPELLPLPPARFDAATTRTAKVSNRSWVQTGTNFYSVPVRLVGEWVTVKMLAEEVVVLDRSGEVARHVRSYGHGKMVLELDHYLPLLARKHRGLDRAVPVRQWLDQASPSWRRLLAELRARQGEVEGSKQFVEALGLVSRHGLEETTLAVDLALAGGHVSLAMIRYHLGARAEAERPAAPKISYAGPHVTTGTSQAYEEVLRG